VSLRLHLKKRIFDFCARHPRRVLLRSGKCLGFANCSFSLSNTSLRLPLLGRFPWRTFELAVFCGVNIFKLCTAMINVFFCSSPVQRYRLSLRSIGYICNPTWMIAVEDSMSRQRVQRDRRRPHFRLLIKNGRVESGRHSQTTK
jgi:hypothetical protein